MLPKKFRCDICNQCFMYQTDLIKHINVHMVKPPPTCRFFDATQTSYVPTLSNAEYVSSSQHSDISMANWVSSAPQTKSSSPKNGHHKSEPQNLCTPIKAPDVSKHTYNMQILSPEKTAPGPSKEYNAIPMEISTTFNSPIKGKKRSKSSRKSLENTDCVTKKDFFCQFCQKHFDSMPELQQHFELTHKVETPFKCILCEQEYQRECKLCLHERDQHADIIIYRCPKCFNRFLTDMGLLAHNCRPKQKLAKSNQSPGSKD